MQQFTPGNYRTQIGFRAVVAQLRQVGTTDWVLRGVVIFNGIRQLHLWTLKGKSHTGDTKFDLVRTL